MTRIRRGYADSADGQIHYRFAGLADGEAIVFLHQTASSGVMFEKVMERLADRYRMYAVDSPGFGQSFQPESIPSLSYLGDRLMEALDSLGLTRVHLVGHHTGGCIAVELPTRFPGRIASLTIIGPVLVNDEERREYEKTFVRPFAIDEAGDFLPVAWRYLDMIGAGSSAELHTRELADHLVAHRTMPMAFSAVWAQDFAEYFRAVDCPLGLMCSKDDVLWPLFERACAMRPDAKTAIVEGGDFQPDRDPDGVAAAIDEFMSSFS